MPCHGLETDRAGIFAKVPVRREAFQDDNSIARHPYERSPYLFAMGLIDKDMAFLS